MLYHNFKFPLITVVGVILSAPLGGLLAMLDHGHAVLGLVDDRIPRAVRRLGADGGRLHLVRERAAPRADSASPRRRATAALLRLRPIMMTALVAALGLLPAALSTGVGSDTQKPFALVIVGGLFSRLLISVFLMPVLYVMFARAGRPSGGVSRGQWPRRGLGHSGVRVAVGFGCALEVGRLISDVATSDPALCGEASVSTRGSTSSRLV